MDVSWEEGRSLLEDLIADYGLPFRVETFWDRLWIYLKALSHRAEELNLTAVKTLRERLFSQVFETLVMASALPTGAFPLADLGTGGGIPGLVLKIVRPELEVTLYEAHPRRVVFLREVIQELSLSGIQAEELHLGREWPVSRFPVVMARGYGSVEKFTRHAERLLSPPGMAFYLWRNEVEPWGKEPVLPILEQVEFELPRNRNSRVLLVFRKS